MCNVQLHAPILGDCPFTGLILPGMILPSQGLTAYLIQCRPSHAASFCTLTSTEQKLKRRPCFFCCRLNRPHPTVPPRRYDMKGRFQMQGGKNWILPKEMNANRFFWDSHWLEIWSNHVFPSIGPNGGSVAMWTLFANAAIISTSMLFPCGRCIAYIQPNTTIDKKNFWAFFT